jgi:replicative DNA helicase|tara:strand:+ start:1820 stop:3169 length:1350 start_codon:yes stop_codon:yes gene_type:complete
MHNKDTEEALLYCIMNNPECIESLRRWIPDSNVFYNDFNKDIWKTICKLNEKGEPIDLVSISTNFPKKKYPDRGYTYEITRVGTAGVTTANAEYLAKKLYEYYLRRNIVDNSHRLISKANDDSVEFDDIIERINTDTGNIINTKPSKHEFDLDTLLEDTDDSIFKSRGIIKTGISKLDSVIYGMTRGEITIIAGRPANGKTTVAANVARELVLSGKRVMMLNREMPNTEMMKKFIAMESDSLSYRNLRHGATSSKVEVRSVIDHIRETYKDKLFMYDSVRDLQSTFEEVKRIKPDVIIDDHIGLIEYSSNDTRDVRHKIRETTMKYKWLAKSNDMCVILVSQLNRNIEHRIDSTPRLSDLAESGSLEQDAEMVVFTHYPYVTRFGQADSDGRVWGQNEMMLIVSKNRYGVPGSVEMGYSGDSCKLFNDILEAQDHETRKKVSFENRLLN